MGHPAVTVVIPSHNHRPYLERAVESALAQTWPRTEVLVIDDGSTDGSRELLERLHAERGGFRLVFQDNRGLVRTLNRGLREATGEFWCELASDDYLPPESVEKRARFLLDRPDHVAVFGDGISVQGEAETGRSILDEKRRGLFAAGDPIRRMLEGVLPVFATGLFRRGVLLRMGGFDERFRFYEDLDTPVRLVLEGKVGFLPEPVLYRREHGGNVSRVTDHVRLEKALCYRLLLEDPRLAAYRRLLRRRLRRSILALGRSVARRGGGSGPEHRVLRGALGLCLCDPRLLWYVIRWGWLRG
ncbi:glycosyltransferase family 2 protein [Dissulfurirhabdus thermomarina]|uniref:Glycosyltransferase family 2 protein n=1 Tax=Dissulfurirhabdus thermomarina TaxID=1765737 RepID=A0A6N9TQ98_DISTH|nr:glycosyltransferase family A protein [Dissulfurirhabdus thermomarina]NDY42283.1 glycosyltransferase family 2 protein [Dissulfurirhabdus thermomarina]NMX23035.1 glycosyltransferase family 2 protein [Dissulfurirhabdus thermomarina]